MFITSLRFVGRRTESKVKLKKLRLLQILFLCCFLVDLVVITSLVVILF
jgi:hypothetical protein